MVPSSYFFNFLYWQQQNSAYNRIKLLVPWNPLERGLAVLSSSFIHFHSFSFTSNFHPYMPAFIKNINSSKMFIHTFLGQAHKLTFFSQLKKETLIYQMKLKFQCHTFKRLMEKIKKKAKFTPILVSRDLRKNERIDEWMNKWMNEWINKWMIVSLNEWANKWMNKEMMIS